MAAFKLIDESQGSQGQKEVGAVGFELTTSWSQTRIRPSFLVVDRLVLVGVFC